MSQLTYLETIVTGVIQDMSELFPLSRPGHSMASKPASAPGSSSTGVALGLLDDLTLRFHQTFVVVTHDPVAASATDRVIFIADGRVAREVAHSDGKTLSDIILSLEVAA